MTFILCCILVIVVFVLITTDFGFDLLMCLTIVAFTSFVVVACAALLHSIIFGELPTFLNP